MLQLRTSVGCAVFIDGERCAGKTPKGDLLPGSYSHLLPCARTTYICRAFCVVSSARIGSVAVFNPSACLCDFRCQSSCKQYRPSEYHRTTRWPTSRSITRTSTTTTSTNTGWSHCFGLIQFRCLRTATAVQRIRIKIDIYYCTQLECCAGFTRALPFKHATNSSILRHIIF